MYLPGLLSLLYYITTVMPFVLCSNDFVYLHIRLYGVEDVWLGLSDTPMEGAFRWVDGTYPMWSAFTGPQPTGWSANNYVEMEFTANWAWETEDENDDDAFICELARNGSS